MPTTDNPPRELDDILATRNVEIFNLVLQTHGFAYREPDTLPAAAGCHGCSWTHPVADRATAQRLHTLHLIEVLRANWIAVDAMDGDIAVSDHLGHADRITDTGDGYETLGAKHVIRCIWCGTTFLGDTIEHAEQAYRRHEDQLRRIDKAQRDWVYTGISDPFLRIRNSYLPRDRRPTPEHEPHTARHRPPRPETVLGTRLKRRPTRFDAV